MAKTIEKLLIGELDLNSILAEVGELSGSKQFTAYFALLYRILLEFELVHFV